MQQIRCIEGGACYPHPPPPLQAPPPSFERTTPLTFKESVTNYKET